MSSIIIDITREDSSSVDAELLLGLRGQTGLSAYEYAVLQGYSGTENDFSILMASYATVAEAAAESASESAQSAVESAQSADASEGYASDAETSMNSASDYASAARASATSASQSAGVASGKADEAGESATSASNSADAAASSASSASTSASSASTSASNASASATAAAGSATSASADADRAEDAKEFLENASATATALPEGSSPSVTLNDGVFNFAIPKGDTGARGEKGDTGSKGDKGDTGDTGTSAGFGTVSASVDDSTGTPSVEVTTSGTDTAKNFAFAFHNLKGAKGDKGDDGTVPDLDLILPTDTASGDIASITDGQSVVPVKSLKVTLEPIQDLHGYDKPWAGGAGRNLLNVGSRVNQTTAEVRYTSDDNYIILNGTKNGGGYATMANLTLTLPAGTYYAKAFVISGTSTGTIDVYVNNGTADITGSLIGSSERTITLESETTLRFRFAVWSDGTVLTNYTVGIVISKTSGIDKFYPYSNICPISGRTEVVAHVADVLVNDDYAFVYGEGLNDTGDFVSSSGYKRTNYIDVSNRNAMTVSVNYVSGGGWILRIVGYDSQKQFSELLLKRTIGTAGVYSFNFDISAYSYVAFALVRTSATLEAIADEDTYTTPLGRTVYGGTLDVVSGELVVDRAMVTLDGSTAGKHFYGTWGATNYGYSVYWNNDVPRDNSAISDKFVVSNRGYDTMPLGSFVGGSGVNTTWTFILPPSVTSLAEANAWLAENPTTIAYHLATPQTYQLTPQTISLLHGNNNVWSDGSVELTYNADVGLYIDKKLGTSGTRTLSMTRTLAKSETDDTKSVQLAEDIIEKGDKVDDISKEDAL